MKLVMAAGVAILLALVVVLSIERPHIQSVSARDVPQLHVTREDYDRIKTGMTYDMVRGLIGSDGDEISRSEIGGTVTVMYQWTGSAGNMNAMFQDGHLVSKAQVGLQ